MIIYVPLIMFVIGTRMVIRIPPSNIGVGLRQGTELDASTLGMLIHPISTLLD